MVMVSEWIEVLDPSCTSREAHTAVSPRLSNLAGKRIAFLTNEWLTWNKVFLPILKELFETKYSVSEVFYQHGGMATPSDVGVIDKLGKQADAVVNSLCY